MAKLVFVNCKKYDRFKNVKFVMKADDFAMRNTLYETPNYERIADVDVKKGKFELNGNLYKVHGDWSVEKI